MKIDIKLIYKVFQLTSSKIYYTLYYNKSRLKIHIIKGLITYTFPEGISQYMSLMIVDNYFLK